VDLAKIRKKARGGGSSSKTKRPPAQEDVGDATEVLQPDPPPLVAPAEITEVLPGDDLPAAVHAPSTDFHADPPPPPVPAAEASEPAVGALSQAGEKLLIFDLALEKYAIPIHDIAQIIDMPPVTPVPNAPAFLAGIFSLRGRIVSVIDVACRLGLERQASETPKVVVLDLGVDHFGLLVDRIDQVVDVNISSLEPPPEGFKPLAQEFVEGVFHHRGRAVAFLNLPMFLTFEV
jgi:purine-binding chemotaxis protein CheW